jgi:hypothetical protein
VGGGVDLEEDGGMRELLYEFIEDLPTLVGLVVHPENVVVCRLGHVLRRLDLGHMVDCEIIT